METLIGIRCGPEFPHKVWETWCDNWLVQFGPENYPVVKDRREMILDVLNYEGDQSENRICTITLRHCRLLRTDVIFWSGQFPTMNMHGLPELVLKS